jgi:hypothetical protein
VVGYQKFEEVVEVICRICGEEFSPGSKHPGYINVCLEEDCRVAAREPHVVRIELTASVGVMYDPEIEL